MIHHLTSFVPAEKPFNLFCISSISIYLSFYNFLFFVFAVNLSCLHIELHLACMKCAVKIKLLLLSQCVLQLLSKSIEQLRQPNAHLQESEEEQEEQHREQTESMQQDRLPPGGVIRKHTLSSSSSNGSNGELHDGHYGVIKVKEEPIDSEDEALTNQSLEQSAYLHQVKGRLVIRAVI